MLRNLLFRINVVVVLLTLLSLCACSLQKPRISLGTDQLLTPQSISLLKNKRVAIVANNASRDSYNKRDITLLYDNKHIHLVSIFTPEHGLDVNLNHDHISDSHDPITHLPVYSLYGTHREPTAQELANVDVILFDLQSVGLRYYTYIATLGHVMDMAQRYHKEVIVLDRPNPLGGQVVDGALLDDHYVGHFTSYYNIPTRYGLTIGELARYDHAIYHQHVDLKVVAMKGWNRNMLYNQTGLKWTATSPALQTIEQTYLYSLFGPLESTNLSIGLGRSTSEEYHLFGAPYITKNQAQQIVSELDALHLPGLQFHYQTWTPTAGHYRNQLCRGMHVDVTDYNAVQDLLSLIAVLEVFQHTLGHQFGLSSTGSMLGQHWIQEAIMKNESAAKIVAAVKQEQIPFLKQRQSILIY